MLLVDKLHNYFEEEFELSDMDSKKLRYSLEFIYNDLSKTLLLFLFFTILDFTLDFIYLSIIIFTIRIFTGGLHFKTYSGCLLFSLLFFVSAIYLKSNFILTDVIIVFMYIFSLVTFIGLAPISSKTRPKYSKSKRRKFKILSILVITIYFVLNLYSNTDPYLIYGIWAMALQSLQIIIAKGV